MHRSPLQLAAAAGIAVIVGVLLVVSAGFFLTPWAPRLGGIRAPIAAAAGFLTGFLGGLTSTGGPPLVLYLYARDLGKEVRMAVMQAVFVTASTGHIPSSITKTGFSFMMPFRKFCF